MLDEILDAFASALIKKLIVECQRYFFKFHILCRYLYLKAPQTIPTCWTNISVMLDQHVRCVCAEACNIYKQSLLFFRWTCWNSFANEDGGKQEHVKSFSCARADRFRWRKFTNSTISFSHRFVVDLLNIFTLGLFFTAHQNYYITYKENV